MKDRIRQMPLVSLLIALAATFYTLESEKVTTKGGK